MNQHINMSNQIVSDSKQINVKFNNEDKTLMLLNFLPTSPIYKNLVTTLMQGEETLMLEEIISALLSFNMWKKAGDENSQSKGWW